MARLSITVLALAALAITWAAIGAYRFLLTPIERQEVQLRAAGLVSSPGAVILVGDSILVPVTSPCASIVNLAMGGAKAADFDASYADAIAARRPSEVIALIGINDLRAGTSPDAVVQSILTFLRIIRNKRPSVRLIVLSILPIIENEIAAKADNEQIRQTNDRLRSALPGPDESYVDIAALFGGATLAPALTHDGLHLNDQGLAILANVLFGGIARPANVIMNCE